MAMNVLHRRICRSDSWADRMHGTTLPWATRDVDLGGEVLEIGPGYGVTTRWLAPRAGALTALEVDPALAADLRAGIGPELGVDVRTGDGAALPFPDASFDAVVCFTMLHHVPTPGEQDRLFAEAARVLRPGGTFAGIDSRMSPRFRLIHIGDTLTAVDPDRLPVRLGGAGLADPGTELGARSFRFRAVRPAGRRPPRAPDSATVPDMPSDWRDDGVRVIPGDRLDTNTPQTPGMNRAAAVTRARAGAQRLWAGTVTIHPGARTGAHHHGELESVIYVVRGRARMKWGENLEFVAEAGPGGFIFVPPYVPHQEINALDDEPLECVLTRSGQDPVVVNLDIDGVADPEHVPWVDPGHPAG